MLWGTGISDVQLSHAEAVRLNRDHLDMRVHRLSDGPTYASKVLPMSPTRCHPCSRSVQEDLDYEPVGARRGDVMDAGLQGSRQAR